MIRDFFVRTAAFEGRMVAMRWLIEFVGICEKKGEPDRPPPRKTSVSIASLGGEKINLLLPEAKTLAKVWKACSQASGHPTRDTNHLPLTDAVLDEALRIIVNHLEHTIYSGSVRQLMAETFVQLPVRLVDRSSA